MCSVQNCALLTTERNNGIRERLFVGFAVLAKGPGLLLRDVSTYDAPRWPFISPNKVHRWCERRGNNGTSVQFHLDVRLIQSMHGAPVLTGVGWSILCLPLARRFISRGRGGGARGVRRHSFVDLPPAHFPLEISLALPTTSSTQLPFLNVALGMVLGQPVRAL